MERRIHHHEVKIPERQLRTANIVPDERSACVLDITPRRRDCSAVDIDQGQCRHILTRQDRPRQQADTAAEIGAGAHKRRQVPNERQAAGVRTVPAEDAGLAPEAEGRGNLCAAGCDGLGEPHGLNRSNSAANSVMSSRAFGYRAAEIGQLPGQTGTAFVLWRQNPKLAGGCQNPERVGDRVSPFQHAGGRKHRKRTESIVTFTLKRAAQRYQRRKLNGIGRNRSQFGRRPAIDAVKRFRPQPGCFQLLKLCRHAERR